VDCNEVIDAVDALKILRQVAALPVNQRPGGTAIGWLVPGGTSAVGRAF
jgi:hypothetical protein